jgi:hypothetical protein
MSSLERYAEVRRRYPAAEMLMGIGNLTELTAADSTGVNALLIAVCQELGVRAVLTTEVIPWARGAVREVDVARRLMHYAVTQHTIPKGVDNRLVTVKDPAVLAYSEEELRALQARITDPNFRIFTDRDGMPCSAIVRSRHGRIGWRHFAQLDGRPRMRSSGAGSRELDSPSRSARPTVRRRSRGVLAREARANVPGSRRTPVRKRRASAERTGDDRSLRQSRVRPWSRNWSLRTRSCCGAARRLPCACSRQRRAEPWLGRILL